MIDIQKKGALFVLVPLLILGLSVTACENTEELVDPSSTTGMVVIDISPDDIDAPWELILPDGSTIGGNGDAALRDLVPGSYQLNFGTVPGYGSPIPRSQTLEAGDEIRLTGTYVARSAPTGSVDINPDPDEIGADWFLTVDGKLAARGSGDSTLTDVSTGEIQLIWNPVQEWAAPQPNPSIQALFEDSLITFAGTYTPLPDGDLGWIVVRPLPEGIEAPWTLSGPQAAGGVGEFQLPGVPVGDYTIEWGEVFGYKTPKPSAGTLTDQQILEFETVYEPATGTITIDPTPNDINAPWTLTPSQGDPFNGSGDTTLRDLPVGQYTLAWGTVGDWLLPDPAEETIFLSIDETRLITGTYEAAPPASGAVVIQVSPAEASWSLTGPGFSTSGTGSASYNTAAPGEYTITWQSLDGWESPNPTQSTQTLLSGETLRFVGSYLNPEGPSIDPYESTLKDGSNVTVSGRNFGSHTMDLSAGVGSSGWIENNSVGTPVTDLSGAPGWDKGFSHNTPAFIDNTIVRSGQNAINASVDRGADGDWQKPVTFNKSSGFDRIYATWWVYFNPVRVGEFAQWKQYYVSPADHHSTCASISSTSAIEVAPLQYRYYQTHLLCCLNCGDHELCYREITPEPYYEPLYGAPWEYRIHNRAQTQSLADNHPPIGQWARMEVYWVASDANAANGRYELYMTPEGQPRHHVDTWRDVMTHNTGCSSGRVSGAPPWQYFGLHGYFDDNGGAFADEEVELYYDDIYVQFGTKARVELGDAADYQSCRRREVQIPTNWTTGSLSFLVNQGDFTPSDDVYLFVIDGNGRVSPGLPITLE